MWAVSGVIVNSSEDMFHVLGLLLFLERDIGKSA